MPDNIPKKIFTSLTNSPHTSSTLNYEHSQFTNLNKFSISFLATFILMFFFSFPCVARTIYTCALNNRGGVEIDLTVTPVEAGIGELHDPIFKGRGKNRKSFFYLPSNCFIRFNRQAIIASLAVHRCSTPSRTCERRFKKRTSTLKWLTWRMSSACYQCKVQTLFCVVGQGI